MSEKTRALVDRALALWQTVYQPAVIVPTVRQLFYALAVEELVPKSEQGYDKVQTTLARARERGEYPWEGIYDGLRQVHAPPAWSDLESFLYAAARSYRFDKWSLQPRRLEVWIEKDAVRGTVEAVTDEYQVPLLCNRGYCSVTAKFEASQRIGAGARTVIYIGDHDPSGINMLEEAEAWVRAAAGERADLLICRIAATDEDHADPTLPHLPINAKDSRADDYRRRFGGEVVEVEAIPPQDLQARLRFAIEDHRNSAAWREAVALELEDQARLERLLEAG